MNWTLKRRTLIATLGFTALTTLGAALSPALAAEKTFALVQINQQALFFNQMNEGAQKAADAAGAKLVIFNANNDPAAQNSAIETYIQQKVDGIAVVAIDVNGIMPAVNQAAEAGIPVVAIDAILPEGPQKAQIGVVGALNSFIQNVRQEGFEKTIKDVDGITSAGVVDGQNVQDNALAAAENLITGNPDLTAIYATGEPALMGAIAAVESQSKQDSVKVFGWDLTAQAIAGIDAGYVAAVIQQDPSAMGAAAVDALKKVADGGSVEKNIAVPVTIVTKDNVEPYRAIFK